MICLLCTQPILIFGEYQSMYCLFHHSEEITKICTVCKNQTKCRRNTTRCYSCMNKKPNLLPILVPVTIFNPQKNEKK